MNISSQPLKPDAPESERRSRINPWNKFLGTYVPDWLLRRSDVSEGAKLCYGRLLRYAGEAGFAFPKQATLAQELGISTRTAHERIRELAERGLVEVRQRGLQRSNHYFFLDHPWMNENPADRRNVAGSERHVGSPPEQQSASALERKRTSVPELRKVSTPTVRESVEGESEKENHITAPCTPQRGDEQEFMKLWNSFPKLTKMDDWTSSRRRQFQRAMRDSYFHRNWREGIGLVSQSLFCTGKGDKGWKATVDWFLKAGSLVKVMELQYDDIMAKPRVNAIAINLRLRAIDAELENSAGSCHNGSELRSEKYKLSALLKAAAHGR